VRDAVHNETRTAPTDAKGIVMKSLIASVLMAGMMLVGTQAFADDTQKDTKHQMMKDCMSRMSAKNDGSTKAQMRAACKTEIKNANKDDSTTHDGMDKKPQ